MPQPLTPRLEMGHEEWEEVGMECGGWEWIDGEIEGGAGSKNEFGGKLDFLGRISSTVQGMKGDKKTGKR